MNAGPRAAGGYEGVWQPELLNIVAQHVAQQALAGTHVEHRSKLVGRV